MSRQKIIGACADLLKETSSAAISTGEVAKKAGCTQPLIYYYWPSEKELFCEAWCQVVKYYQGGWDRNKKLEKLNIREKYCSKSKVKEVLEVL